MKLIPLYVMDSILKNVRPQSVYSGLVARNLTRVMGYAFMSVDNAIKPKFIKLLKTWEDNKVFSEHKILEVRDTMMLMLTNGGIFPEHLNHGGAGPQMGGHAHMASGPMDVEASYGVIVASKLVLSPVVRQERLILVLVCPQPTQDRDC